MPTNALPSDRSQVAPYRAVHASFDTALASRLGVACALVYEYLSRALELERGSSDYSDRFDGRDWVRVRVLDMLSDMRWPIGLNTARRALVKLQNAGLIHVRGLLTSPHGRFYSVDTNQFQALLFSPTQLVFGIEALPNDSQGNHQSSAHLGCTYGDMGRACFHSMHYVCKTTHSGRAYTPPREGSAYRPGVVASNQLHRTLTSGHIPDVVKPAFAALAAVGVEQSCAARYVAEFGSEAIVEQAAALPYRCAAYNPAGLLVTMLRKRAPLPQPYLSELETKAQQEAMNRRLAANAARLDAERDAMLTQGPKPPPPPEKPKCTAAEIRAAINRGIAMGEEEKAQRASKPVPVGEVRNGSPAQRARPSEQAGLTALGGLMSKFRWGS